MPARKVSENPSCYQGGNQKIYCGMGAKERAIKQGLAIEATGWKEAETFEATPKFIKKYIDKVDWDWLSENPAIFKPLKDKTKSRTMGFRERIVRQQLGLNADSQSKSELAEIHTKLSRKHTYMSYIRTGLAVAIFAVVLANASKNKIKI